MTPEPIEEAELQSLVRKAQDGDSDAFERIYGNFFLPVYRFTAFRVPTEVAEDLVADIFVKAWEKLHQYSSQKGVPFGAWLFRIARHTIIDNYRKDRSYEELSEELMDTDDLNRADARTKNADTLRVVREALEKLPTRYRDILLLSYVAGLPHSEVARVLRMSEGGVRILKFRALKKLEGLLPPEMHNLA